MEENWEKFSVLVWKNFVVLRRRIAPFAFSLVTVLLLLGMLVLARINISTKSEAKVTYSSFALDQNAHGFQISGLDRIVWSPCNKAIDGIMTEVATIFHLQNNNKCYPNASNLQIYAHSHSRLVFAGFQFDDDYADTETLNPNVHVTFRYPSELRIPPNDSEIDPVTWETQYLFPKESMSGPRSFKKEKGAPPEYFHETFLTFQYEISRQIIKYFVKDANLELPNVVMQRYPYPDWIDDPLLPAAEKFLGILIVLIVMQVHAITTEDIVTEKETQMKEIMKIMGLSNWLHWTAWFTRALILGTFVIVLIIITLKTHWRSSGSIFTKTNSLVLIVLLMIYICCTITFCFVITAFLSKVETASMAATILWLLTLTPYFMFAQRHYYQISMAQKIFSSFLSNTAICLGFQLIVMFETFGEGAQWKYLFSAVSPNDRLTLGLIMIMLIIDTFLYLLIALYVEAVFPGDYGVPRVWYFPFTKNFWCGTESLNTGPDNNAYVRQSSEAFENEPINLRAVIVAKNLKKVYSNNTVAVRDFFISMYEDQITVLLGHNGSGKTTVMSLLTGVLPPTMGTAVINGYDIRTDMNKIRKSLAFCPQHNVLFKELTVEDHLYFFGKLKGLNEEEVKQEIIKYTEILGLVEKKDERVKNLSGAMLRKLSLGIALCGKSEVIFLDEPSAGVDPGTRRTLWELLQKEKKGRTILLSTHFMDEADVLGDRIAIMVTGQLKSCGSSFFLKKRFGTGYTLIIEKSEKFDENKMTKLIRSHVPNAQIKENAGSELSYTIPEEQTRSFEELFSDMEDNLASLGIKSFGISRTTLEEVFMKIGVMHAHDKEHSLHIDDKDDENNKTSETKGCALQRNQFLAMMMKRIVYVRRTWFWLFLQIVIPVCLVIVFMAIGRKSQSTENLPKFDYNLNLYNSITAVTTSDVNDSYYNAYKKLLQGENRDIKDWKTENMISKMLESTDENAYQVRMQYIIGATFEPDKITAWFNNEPYHSPPLALQYVMNSILQAKMGSQYSIQISLRPLPYELETRDKITSSSRETQQHYALIGTCVSIVAAFYVLFMTKERVSKFKHLQLVSGAELLTFWCCSFLWDFFTFIITSLCLSLTLIAFQDDGFRTSEDFGRIFVVLLCFGFAILPLMYLLSFLFTSATSGFLTAITVNVLIGKSKNQIDS